MAFPGGFRGLVLGSVSSREGGRGCSL